MGTKNNPGAFDCYAAALPDEPLFVLLGRDPLAPALVELWATTREALGEDSAAVGDARDVAAAMKQHLYGLRRQHIDVLDMVPIDRLLEAVQRRGAPHVVPVPLGAATFKHVKRGGIYRVLGRATLQARAGLADLDELVIYEGTSDQRLFARPTAEFFDGRFEPVDGDGETVDVRHEVDVDELREQLAEMTAERDRLLAMINTPELVDFPRAVYLESVHQLHRWGAEDRSSKTPQEWFWLVGYLGGRALGHHKEAERLEELAASSTEVDAAQLRPQIDHHRKKATHHVITMAAAASHWHADVLRRFTGMKPGNDSAAQAAQQLEEHQHEWN